MSSGSKVGTKSFVPSGHTEVYEFNPPGENKSTFDTSSYSNKINRSEGRTWSGSDTPNYRQIIKQRGNATNSYVMNGVFYEASPFVADEFFETRQFYGSVNPSYRPRYQTFSHYSSFVIPDDPGPLGFNASAQTMAAQQFTRRARQTFSEAQALVTGGELAEAVRMITGARDRVWDKLVDFQSAAKKRNRGLKTVKRRNKVLSETWLEYSFGWAPLVDDVSNLANAAAASYGGSFRSFEIRGKGEASTSFEEGNGWAVMPSSLGFNYDLRLRTTSTSKCYYVGVIDVDISQPGHFASQFGLTMDNWIPSLWELVPWSFAVDYFTGFGDFLSSLTLPTTNFRYICRTNKVETVRETYEFKKVTPNIETSTTTLTGTASPGTGKTTNVHLDRDQVYNVIRAPEFRVPGYKSAYINLAALTSLRFNNRL